MNQSDQTSGLKNYSGKWDLKIIKSEVRRPKPEVEELRNEITQGGNGSKESEEIFHIFAK